jgi:hypothetical protein
MSFKIWEVGQLNGDQNDQNYWWIVHGGYFEKYRSRTQYNGIIFEFVSDCDLSSILSDKSIVIPIPWKIRMYLRLVL